MRVRLVSIILAFVALLAARAEGQVLATTPANGVIDANGESVCAPVTNIASVGIAISETFVGTLTFRESPNENGTSPNAIKVLNEDQALTATATAPGIWTKPNSGYLFICVTATIWSSGSATVTFRRGLTAPGGVPGAGGGGAGDASFAEQQTQTSHLADIKAKAEGSIAVTGSFWQATQPVSGTFWQATQPVSGTFWQATQPVSLATAPTTPVTGTFWQATQPVSGTFWQATQPVSLATAPTTPVTGTFWQATQPVSGTVTAISGTAANFLARVSGAVTPAVDFANPTTAIPTWSLNGCYDGATWDPCPTSTGGAGAVDANTTRTVTATDSPDVVSLGLLATYLQPSSHTIIRSHASAGDDEDETQVKATAGVLLAISARNAHATTAAYVRCTNATAANTTPGTTAVIYEMIIPPATLGFVQAAFGPGGRAFSTALTCYVVTGKALNDTTDAAVDDVVVNIDYR